MFIHIYVYYIIYSYRLQLLCVSKHIVSKSGNPGWSQYYGFQKPWFIFDEEFPDDEWKKPKHISNLDFDRYCSFAGWEILFYLLCPAQRCACTESCQYSMFQIKVSDLHEFHVLCFVLTVSLFYVFKKLTNHITSKSFIYQLMHNRVGLKY
jgi:hypothetical protein